MKKEGTGGICLKQADFSFTCAFFMENLPCLGARTMGRAFGMMLPQGMLCRFVRHIGKWEQ
ncbi:hypothetical protein TMES_05935 [Thalassospira mesophila]|uniref:Uncharacterized protein n=1 Tax=Thalassospira mesophila TaxID=1293891 RepID=A0A1Y2L2W7_9PROT|nr:hypothetical protein TMES_05935 [Thalassospira mesophila]